MISIVSYTDKYKDEVIKLILDIWTKEFDFGWVKRPDIHDIPLYYQKDGKSNFWLALDEGRVVGTIGLQNYGEGVGYLKRMAVVFDMRRKGIGEKLLKTLLDFAHAHGYKEILVGVSPGNLVAIKFYRKYGFKKTKIVTEELIAVGDAVCLKLEV